MEKEWLSLTSAGAEKEVLIRADVVTVLDYMRLPNGVVCTAVVCGPTTTPVKQRLSAIKEVLEGLGAHISVIEEGEPIPTIFTANA